MRSERAPAVLPTGIETAPLLAGYRLISCLGRGGVADVWEAEAPGGFRVALKLVPLTTRLRSGEFRAIEILRTVRHPHLLGIFAAWNADDHLVIGMELADRSLWDRFLEARAEGLRGIPRSELLGYLSAAADAIDYLNDHRHAIDQRSGIGIQHGDLKPQNILLFGTCAKVADFGMARIMDRDIVTHTGSCTLAYAPPELFGKRIARQSDQYALAVTYCQLRGGSLPFRGTAAQITIGHLMGIPELDDLPEAERGVVARALSKSPEDRWANCREFVDALGTVPTDSEGGGPDRLPSDTPPDLRPDETAASRLGSNRPADSFLLSDFVPFDTDDSCPSLPVFDLADDDCENPDDGSGEILVFSTASHDSFLSASTRLLWAPASALVRLRLPRVLSERLRSTAARDFAKQYGLVSLSGLFLFLTLNWSFVNWQRHPIAAAPNTRLGGAAFLTSPARVTENSVVRAARPTPPPDSATAHPARRLASARPAPQPVNTHPVARPTRAPVVTRLASVPPAARPADASPAAEAVRKPPATQLASITIAAPIDVPPRRPLDSDPDQPLRPIQPPDLVTWAATGWRPAVLWIQDHSPPRPVRHELRTPTLATIRPGQEVRVPVGLSADELPDETAIRVDGLPEGIHATIPKHSDKAGDIEILLQASAQAEPAVGEAHISIGDGPSRLEAPVTIRIEPGLGALAIENGCKELARGRHEEAIALFTEALRLEPENLGALRHRAAAYHLLGRYRKASADYDKLLALRDHDADAYLGRARVHRLLGKTDEATRDYSESIRLSPTADAYLGRGSLRQNRGDYAGALTDLDAALRLRPGNPAILYRRALTRYRSGDNAGAIADFTEVIRIDPEHLGAYRYRGDAYARLGNLDQATADHDTYRRLVRAAGSRDEQSVGKWTVPTHKPNSRRG